MLFTAISIIFARQLLAKWRREQQAELNLRVANQELELRVAERTAALRTTNAELEAEIAERRRVEEVLHESEARFRVIFEHANDAIHLDSADDQILQVNPRMCELMGYSREELLTMCVSDLQAPEVRGQPGQVIRSEAAGRAQVTFEGLNLHRSGRRIPVEISVARVESAEGELHVSIVRDITERKRTEEALRQNQQNLARAQQIGRMGSWDWDVEGQSLTWSDELYRIFGIPHEYELTLEAIEACIHPKDRPKNAVWVQRLLSSSATQAQYEFRIIRPDGEIRSIEQNIEVTCDETGAVSRMFGVMQDITERKRIEAALYKSEEEYRTLFREMLDGFALHEIICDGQGNPTDYRFLAVNPAFERLTGLKAQDIVGRTVLEVLPGIERYWIETYGKVTLSGEPAVFENYAAELHKHFQVTAFQPAPNQFACVFADITERKQAEERLAQAARDLARSNTDLERFAYVASHDLQEPLRMVASFVQLLGERYQGQLDSDADEFIGFAVDGAKRMQRLINDLLEYSRVGTRGEPPRPTDANAALADALWNLDLAITDAGATVTHDPLPAVIADPTQLTQLFQNLISNAIKFHGSEPPVVHVFARQMDDVRSTMDDVHRTSNLAHPTSGWIFAVRDNGIGIAPADHDRIFGIFQRLHTREEYAGTGIGLAVCQRIVERHGGRIWVESQVGQGTTFYFTLPAVA